MWNPQPIEQKITINNDYLDQLDDSTTMILESQDVPKPQICGSGITILFHDLKNTLETSRYRKNLQNAATPASDDAVFSDNATGNHPAGYSVPE